MRRTSETSPRATSVESELRDALEELAGTDDFVGLAAQVETAADALAAAANALAAVGAAGGEVTRGTRAMLRALLDEGGEK